MKKLKALALAAGAFLLVGCGTSYDAAVDETLVHVNGYTFVHSDHEIKGCVKPGTSGRDGWSDDYFAYPVSQSYWKFADPNADKDADVPPYTVVTKDNIDMTVSGVAIFKLNWDCEALKEFHQQIGNRYMPLMESDRRTDNWSRMLSTFLGQPLQQALNNASSQFDMIDLYSNAEAKVEWQSKVEQSFVTTLQQLTGGKDYFCSPNFEPGQDCGSPTITLQKPVPPSNIVDALTAKVAAQQENQAQKLKNETQLTQSQGLQNALRELGLEGAAGLQAYTFYLAVTGGEVTVIPLPQGGGVNLNVPGGTP